MQSCYQWSEETRRFQLTSSHVSHCRRGERSCVHHFSVHKAAVKIKQARKAVALWFDSPASHSQISAFSFWKFSKKSSSLRARCIVTVLQHCQISISFGVWKKKKKKTWGVWVRDMEVFHYARANPATAENRIMLCSSLKWKCESTQTHCLRNRCSHKAQAANRSARVLQPHHQGFINQNNRLIWDSSFFQNFIALYSFHNIRKSGRTH